VATRWRSSPSSGRTSAARACGCDPRWLSECYGT
jgi:hypothetical protein